MASVLITLSISIAKDLEQLKEQVDDVEVEHDGGKNVVVRTELVPMLAAHDHLRVDDDVEHENGHAEVGANQVSQAVREDKYHGKEHADHEELDPENVAAAEG